MADSGVEWVSPAERPLGFHPDHEEGAWCPRCQEEIEYLDRMAAVEPSLMLRRAADQFPDVEWLCWLPEEDRRWYMTVGDAQYVRDAFWVYLPDWVLKALAA